MLQELPNFESEDQAGVNIGLIDFSLLGGTDDATIPDSTACANKNTFSYF
jgi:hypothetical protein